MCIIFVFCARLLLLLFFLSIFYIFFTFIHSQPSQLSHPEHLILNISSWTSHPEYSYHTSIRLLLLHSIHLSVPSPFTVDFPSMSLPCPFDFYLQTNIFISRYYWQHGPQPDACLHDWRLQPPASSDRPSCPVFLGDANLEGWTGPLVMLWWL